MSEFWLRRFGGLGLWPTVSPMSAKPTQRRTHISGAQLGEEAISAAVVGRQRLALVRTLTPSASVRPVSRLPSSEAEHRTRDIAYQGSINRRSRPDQVQIKVFVKRSTLGPFRFPM